MSFEISEILSSEDQHVLMKPYHAVIVFVVLVCGAFLSSIHSYRTAEDHIVNDMNQALALTLQNKREGWITPDTINNYRSHLQNVELRKSSIIYYAIDEGGHGLCSKRMRWQGTNTAVDFRGYANCSIASVLMMSDQTWGLSLSMLAMLWLLLSMAYLRSRQSGVVLGRMIYNEVESCFYGSDGKAVKFTPMQQRVMTMFYTSNDNRLAKQEICNALWPKKPDSSDTLYALISRLKPILEQHGNLKIICERGKYYQLKERS